MSSDAYPDEAVKAHREGLIHIHCLDEPDKGYSAGWSISSLTETDKSPPRSLGGLLTGIAEPLGRLRAEWAGPQAVNSLDVYAAAHLPEGDVADAGLREKLDGFVTLVNGSLGLPLAVSLDLAPEATLTVPPSVVVERGSREPGGCLDRFNLAFAEALERSYREGMFGVVPVLNVTRRLDWGSAALSRYAALSYRYGYPVYQNYVTGTLHPRYLHETESGEPDPAALYLRHGGVHGNSDSQGCLDVVTVNLPRLSRMSGSEEEFFRCLDETMELVKAAHESKRRHLESLLAAGKMPETAMHLDSLDWHFSAVNLVGMNEALQNVIAAGTGHVAGKAVTYRLLEQMVGKIEEIQGETGSIYTLEAAPCEEAGARLNGIDAATQAPGGAQPFYTGSTELPPGHGDDLWDAMEHQKKYHGIYTGGDVFQIHLAQGIAYMDECKLLIRRSLEVFGFNHLKVSPVFSLCKEHGYLEGERHACPACGAKPETYVWVDCSPRGLGTLQEGLKEAHRRRVYSDVKRS